jgi:hypothetical protein
VLELRSEYVSIAKAADVADVLVFRPGENYFWNSKTDNMQWKPVFIHFIKNKSGKIMVKIFMSGRHGRDHVSISADLKLHYDQSIKYFYSCKKNPYMTKTSF